MNQPLNPTADPTPASDVITDLEKVRKRKLPAFLREITLPTVHTADGQELSPRALAGVIELLRREGLETHHPDTREVLDALNPNDVVDLGERIFLAWAALESMAKRDLWGLLQLAHTRSSCGLNAVLLAYWETSKDDHRKIYKTLLARGRDPLSRTITHLVALKVNRVLFGKHFGVGLAFGQRDKDCVYWSTEMTATSYPSTIRRSERGHYVHFSFSHPEPARVGVMAPKIALVFTEAVRYSDHDYGSRRDFERAVLEEGRSLEAELNADLARFAEAVDAAGAEVCWAEADWRHQMIMRPPTRLKARGLLFTQAGGPTFAVSPELVPADVDGQRVILDKTRFINRVRVESLSADERGAWEARMGAWDADWRAQLPEPLPLEIEEQNTSGRLSELRALLTEAPGWSSWASIQSALNALPIGELELAVEYAAPHLERWKVRRAPWGTWLSEEATSPFAFGEDPRLRLCNALNADEGYKWLEAVCKKPNLSHIESLTTNANTTRMIMDVASRDDFLPGLQRLTLRSANDFYLESFTRFTRSPLLSRISELHVCDSPSIRTRVTAKFIRALTASEAFRGLKALGLDGVYGKDALPFALLEAEEGALASLTWLNLTYITPRVAERLVARKDLAGLTVLGGSFSDNDARAILEASPDLPAVGLTGPR